MWCETSKPDLDQARRFAEAVRREHPDQLLAYNCSPSFNWKQNLDDATIARFQRELGAMSTVWTASADEEGVFEGRDRDSGEKKWTGTRVDLVFGSNSQLRALAEVYASDDCRETFVKEFVAAWDKVMNLDRFDVA